MLFLEWSRETDRPLWRGTCHPKGPPQVPHQLVTPERQITVGPLLHQHGKMTVIVAYAPTDVADEDAKDAFFDQLHQTVGQAHHTTSPSSSPMPMPLCLAVIGPLTHLSAQFLLTGLQTTTVIAYSFSATTTISVLPIPGFPESLSITGHGTVQMAAEQESVGPYSHLSTLEVVCH